MNNFSSDNHSGIHRDTEVQIIDHCNPSDQQRRGDFWINHLETMFPKNITIQLIIDFWISPVYDNKICSFRFNVCLTLLRNFEMIKTHYLVIHLCLKKEKSETLHKIYLYIYLSIYLSVYLSKNRVGQNQLLFHRIYNHIWPTANSMKLKLAVCQLTHESLLPQISDQNCISRQFTIWNR